MALSAPVLLALVVVGGISLYNGVLWLLSTLRPANYPPGPRTLLGLGNLHQIPLALPFLKYHEWAREYGPVVGLKLGPNNMVILNDANLIYEHIVKRGQHFSARPPRYIAQEHILPDARNTYSLFMRNDYSRRLRTITKQFLVGQGLFKLAPMQKAAGTRLIYNLFQSSDDWMEHINQWGVTTPIAMLSGSPVEDYDENWVHDYHYSQGLMEELVDPASAPPVDIFPILRWVPAIFAGWKGKAIKTRKALLYAYGAMMNQAKKARHGTFQSLIPRLLEQSVDPSTAPEGRFTEQEIKLMMGGMLDAAVDSSVVTFQIILLALAAHPEAQRKAQAEIDRVFNSDTALPESIDLNELPYLNACVTEALRWRPVSPLGLPRETLADEIVMGYHIPKGATVVLNQWTIQQDPEFYDQPDRYMPERFILDEFGAKKGISQVGRKTLYTFGAGRRECPGKDFFFQNMRLGFAQILWAFDIVPTEPLHTDILTGFTSSVVLRPKPFGVKFVPRRANFAGILAEEKRKADLKLKEILT
ncbi:cytochrome P450 [Aspergillus lucknowensis]|uniref:Cytochrome P450 n=1 Tax=Aspergillus lucknowensis TaxID=176173 RepID=A0ABR4M562_9EURO